MSLSYPEHRPIAPALNEADTCLLQKYASHAELQSVAARKHLPDVLKLPPIPHHGKVNEIIGKLGTQTSSATL